MDNGDGVAKLLSRLALVIGVALALLVALATTVPVAPLTGGLQQQLGVTLVGNARIVGGRGYVADSRGTDVFRWRWCPSRGVAAFCFQVSGRSGFFDGVVRSGLGSVEISQLAFSRLDPRALGVRGAEQGSRLRGELAGVRWGWFDNCPHWGLAQASGTIQYTGPVMGTRQIELVGDGDHRLALGGDLLQGDLDLRGNRIAGALALYFDGRPDNPANIAEINISRAMGCEANG